MYLLNEKVTNSESFSFLCSFFKNSNILPNISYKSFKIHLVNFAKDVMTNYIKETPCSNDSCHCFCYEKMDNFGSFNSKFNIIFLNEKVVEKMYKKRDLSSLAVLFHELNHFKIKYDVKLGYFDENLVRVIKEELISKSPLLPSFIKNCEYDKNTYYEDNYTFYSEEKLADLCALENLLFFMEKAVIHITEGQKQQINNLINQTTSQYRNYFRDVHNNMHFNSYVIDFEEAFDILIKDNPKWLEEYSQLQIEYYIDKNGKVLKRSDEQLKELLEMETNTYKKQYIEKLLNKKVKKNNYSNTKRPFFDKKIHTKDLKVSNKL